MGVTDHNLAIFIATLIATDYRLNKVKETIETKFCTFLILLFFENDPSVPQLFLKLQQTFTFGTSDWVNYQLRKLTPHSPTQKISCLSLLLMFH